MADLEDAGLLSQPHTSAGRVPTAQGLRYFVDSLLKLRPLTSGEKESIRQRYGETPVEVQEILRDTSRLLSELSRHAALVLVPRPDSDVLEQLKIVPLRGGALLAILVTKSGLVQNRLVASQVAITPGDLDRIHNYLNDLLGGLTLDEVKARVLDEIGQERTRLDALATQALRLGAQAVHGASAPEVFVEGQANLVGEADDLDHVKALLRALEEKQLLATLLEQTAGAPGVRVFIGAELQRTELSDCAIVTAAFGPEDQPIGSVGVIGPTHMNYSKVIPLVDFTAEIVSGVLWRRVQA
jgi:heat-inducible transcriptional repressor